MSTMGHNNPPVEISLIDSLKDDYADECAEAESAIHALKQLPTNLKDQFEHDKAVDAVLRANAATTALENARKKEKKPFFDACKEVDGFFNGQKSKADEPKSDVERSVGAYQRAKADAERKAREEEMRKAQAEAAKAAEEAARIKAANEQSATTENSTQDDRHSEYQAEHKAWEADQAVTMAQQKAAEKPADLVRSRTASGGTSSLKRHVSFTIDDFEKIPLELLRPYLSQPDIEKAIRKFISSGRRELAGVTITEGTKALIR